MLDFSADCFNSNNILNKVYNDYVFFTAQNIISTEHKLVYFVLNTLAKWSRLAKMF